MVEEVSGLEERAEAFLAWHEQCRDSSNPVAMLCATAKMTRWSDDEPDMWAEAAAIIREQRAEIERLANEVRNFAAVEQHKTDLIKSLRKDAERLDALEAMTHKGHCPNLVFDDNANWAVSQSGTQPVPMYPKGGRFEETVAITCFVDPGEWRPSLREAIDAAMEDFNGRP